MNRLLTLSLSCLTAGALGYASVTWWPQKSQAKAGGTVQKTAVRPAESLPSRPLGDPILRRIQSTSPTDYPALWAEFGKLPVKSSRSLWQRMLLLYWARKDPVGGHSFLEKESVPSEMHSVLIREWWRVDPAILTREASQSENLQSLALEALASAGNADGWKSLAVLPGEKSFGEESKRLIQRLAERDFSETERWCRQNLDTETFASLHPQILGGLAKQNPKEAWRRACAEESPLNCQEEVMQIWCRLDPQAAMAALLDIQDTLPKSEPAAGWGSSPEPMTGARGAAVAALFAQDPKAALQLAEKLHSSSGKIEEITEGLAGALPKDPAAVANLLAQFSSENDSGLRGYLTAAAAMARWSDPAAATALLSQQTKEPQVIANALAQWIKEDEIVAVEFLSGQPDEVRGETWRKMEPGAVSLSKISPDALAAMLKDAEILPPQILDNLVNLGELPMLSQQRLTNDETSFYLTEIAMNLGEAPGREEARRKIFANQLASSDQGVARHYVSEIIGRQGLQPEQRAALAQSMGQTWTTVDAQSASEYITEQPPGIIRDHFALGLSEALAWDDPKAAFVWAKNITDQKTRQNALKSVLDAWKEADAAAAAASRGTLTAEDLQALSEIPKEETP